MKQPKYNHLFGSIFMFTLNLLFLDIVGGESIHLLLYNSPSLIQKSFPAIENLIFPVTSEILWCGFTDQMGRGLKERWEFL